MPVLKHYHRPVAYQMYHVRDNRKKDAAGVADDPHQKCSLALLNYNKKE